MIIKLVYSPDGGWFNIFPENEAEAIVLKQMSDKKFQFNSCTTNSTQPYPYCRGLGPIKNADKETPEGDL